MKLLKGMPQPKGLPSHDPGRQQAVAEAAYRLAELRGFEPGRELDDWIMAENMVDAGAARGAKG